MTKMSKMRYGFEMFSRNNRLLSVLMILMGLLLVFWPGQTLALAARILGIGLLVGAVLSYITWHRGRRRRAVGYTSLAVAICLLVIGVAVLVAPQGLIALLPRAVGVLVIVNGILNLAQSLELRNDTKASLISSIVLSVLTILAGGFILIRAIDVAELAVKVVGGIVIYNGVSNLFIEARYRHFWG